jgi:hypothetical protein
MRNIMIVLGLGLAALALPRAQTPAKVTEKPSLSVQQMTSPAGADSEAPRLTVEGDRVILSWVERHEDHVTLRFAERTPKGWSEARTVVSSSEVMANAADVPLVKAMADGTVLAAWPNVTGDQEGYDLQLSSSKDGGRTWTPLVSPHRKEPEAQHGFVSLFPTVGGGFGLVWLDGRETATMTLRSAEYGPDRAKRREIVVDDRVCECCPTSAALTSEGPIIAFRDRSPDEIRDIAVSRLVAGKWTPSAIVHRDGWKITGCPVNGPSISAAGADVAVGWYTAASGAGRAFAAFSSDGGRTFGSPIRVDDHVAIGRVQISVLNDRSAAVSWIESLNPGSQFKLRRVDKTGSRLPSVAVGEGIGSAHPRLIAVRDELLLAWVENTRGTTRVRVARVRI